MSNSPTARSQKLTFPLLLLSQHPPKKFQYCYYFFLISLGSPDTDESIAWFRVDFKCYRLKPRFLFFFFSILPLVSRNHKHTYTHRFHSQLWTWQEPPFYLLHSTSPVEFLHPSSPGQTMCTQAVCCCSSQHAPQWFSISSPAPP